MVSCMVSMRPRALRHAIQKVSILALSKAQSFAPHNYAGAVLLKQFHLNHSISFNKKHKTLLVWPTKV